MVIKQIMPSVGWRVVYVDDNGSFFASDLVAWALVEWTENGQVITDIRGCDVDYHGDVEVLDPHNNTSNVVAILPPNKNITDEDVQEFLQNEVKRRAPPQT